MRTHAEKLNKSKWDDSNILFYFYLIQIKVVSLKKLTQNNIKVKNSVVGELGPIQKPYILRGDFGFKSPFDFLIAVEVSIFYVLLFLGLIFFYSEVNLAVLLVLGDMHKYSFFVIDDPFFNVFFLFDSASYFSFFLSFIKSFWDPCDPRIFLRTRGVWQIDYLNFLPKYSSSWKFFGSFGSILISFYYSAFYGIISMLSFLK